MVSWGSHHSKTILELPCGHLEGQVSDATSGPAGSVGRVQLVPDSVAIHLEASGQKSSEWGRPPLVELGMGESLQRDQSMKRGLAPAAAHWLAAWCQELNLSPQAAAESDRTPKFHFPSQTGRSLHVESPGWASYPGCQLSRARGGGSPWWALHSAAPLRLGLGQGWRKRILPSLFYFTV